MGYITQVGEHFKKWFGLKQKRSWWVLFCFFASETKHPLRLWQLFWGSPLFFDTKRRIFCIHSSSTNIAGRKIDHFDGLFTRKEMVIFPMASYAKFTQGNGVPQPLRSDRTVRRLEPWKGYCWWKHMRQLGWPKLPWERSWTKLGKVASQGTKISPQKWGMFESMIFLFPRWDMLIPWRVALFIEILLMDVEIPRPTTWDVGYPAPLGRADVLNPDNLALDIQRPPEVWYLDPKSIPKHTKPQKVFWMSRAYRDHFGPSVFRWKGNFFTRSCSTSWKTVYCCSVSTEMIRRVADW